jgi:hypothetical protein
VARWDGSDWRALGTGVTGGNVTSLAVLRGDLYLGGLFTRAGGQPSYYLAAWNDSAGVVGIPPGTPAEHMALSPPWPNPSSGAIHFSYSLAAPAPVTLEILDLAGRRVATLAQGIAPAGRHALAWDGRGPGGHPVAAGVYFASLEAPGQRWTRRLVRLAP